MKKRGQALVEFVIIFPIFIMLVLGVFDIGKILHAKIFMEDVITDIVSYYDTEENISIILEKFDLNSNVYELKVNEDTEYLEFSLIKKIDIVTPGLNFIFDNPYLVEVSRSIANE